MLSAAKVVLLLLPRRRLAPRPNESDFNRPEERGDASEGAAGAVPVDGGSTAITRSGGSSATDDDGITTLLAARAGLYSRLATYPL